MLPVYIYTDGSSRGNPGPGGFGVVLISGNKMKEISKGYRRTTNNRMELLAVIVGLEALKKTGLDVQVVSDSKYVVDAVTKGWLQNWERKGFAKVKNPDLWRRMLPLLRQQNVRFQWVKGHNNHKWNERCDKLATDAALASPTAIDQGFEAQEKGLF
ncbi:ribonuclease HI [Phaeocystidibacter luteus]|uniref:Ribonuclease H n=1 Tax=Phaeocystidibacter luteus TaxID=911197 RepID=A0A6N6RID3_9FLAO|nr:ribonuclease HI [Phaeocystidibacter luteus]KAB2810123.1 ribonuclease HI [Phaeocystidibacter luteus]